MTTLKQQLAIDGQVIPNNDPEMVITLDAHPSVQIKSGGIGVDTITYEFLGNITQDSTYSLNLTFVYKGIHKLVMPLTFEHTVNNPILNITNLPKSVKIWDEGNDVPFTVSYLGDPEEEITGSISDVVITPNTYVATTGGSNWNIFNASTTGKALTEVEYAFNVTHGEETFGVKTRAKFTIDQWSGSNLEVTPVGDMECTNGIQSELVFDVRYKGKYSNTIMFDISYSTLNNLDFISQRHDEEKQQLILTVRGKAVNTVNNKFSFKARPDAVSSIDTQTTWWNVKSYAAAITGTTPLRTDSKFRDPVFVSVTDLRMGHLKIDLYDPRIKIATGHTNFPFIATEPDKLWYLNAFNSNSFVNIGVTITAPGYTNFVPTMIGMYSTPTGGAAGTVLIRSLNNLEGSEHGIQKYLTLNDSSQPLAGLTLVGKPVYALEAPGNPIKIYEDIAPTGVTAEWGFGVDVGHQGGRFSMGALYKAGQNFFTQKPSNFVLNQAPMVTASVKETVDVKNTDLIAVQFTVKQKRFGIEGLVDVPSLAFKGMVVGGEATAGGTFSDKGNGVYETLMRPTAVSGDATLTGTATLSGIEYPIVFTVKFNKVANLAVTSKPLSVSVYDTGTDLPFSVSLDGVVLDEQLTDIVITPTTNVITHGGKEWEIWTAPVAGVAEKVTYTFNVPVGEGKVETHTFEATFNIGAWDGKMFKVAIYSKGANHRNYNVVGLTATQDTYYTIVPVYRGKPAWDKISVSSEQLSIATLGAITQDPDDPTRARVAVRGVSGTSQSAVLKYTVNGTPGTTVDTDTVTTPSQGFYLVPMGLRAVGTEVTIKGQPGTNLLALSGGGKWGGNLFKDGQRLDWDDPDIEILVKKGSSSYYGTNISCEWLGNIIAGPVFQITGDQIHANGWLNFSTFQLRSDPVKYKYETTTGPECQILVTVQSGGVSANVAPNMGVLTPVTDNHREFILNKSDGTGVLSDYQVTNARTVNTPLAGNATIDGGYLVVTADPVDKTKFTVDIKTGHTGDSANILGLAYREPDTSNGGLGSFYKMNGLVSVAKQVPTCEFLLEEVAGKEGQVVDVEFTLAMKHYPNADADLSTVVFKTINITGGGSGTTLPTHVEGNKFKVPVTIGSSFGTVSVTGTFSEVEFPTIQFGFADTFVTTNDSKVVVTSVPLDVSVFDTGSTYPFTVTDDTGSIIDTITNVTITPTTNIITSGGSNWEIWTAPTAGVVEKIQYEFTVTSHGVQETKQFIATFNIGPWDGIMLKIKQDYGFIDNPNEISVATGAANARTFKLYPIYRGKPAADKIEMGGIGLYPADIAWTSSVEGDAFLLKLTGQSVSQRTDADLRYRIKGTPGTTAGIDMVQHNNLYARVVAPGFITVNVSQVPSNKQIGFNMTGQVKMEVFNNGVHIPLDDPDLTFTLRANTTPVDAWVYHGKDKTAAYATFLFNYTANQGTTNYYDLTYKKGETPVVGLYSQPFNWTFVTTLNPTVYQLETSEVADYNTTNTVPYTVKDKSNNGLTSMKIKFINGDGGTNNNVMMRPPVLTDLDQTARTITFESGWAGPRARVWGMMEDGNYLDKSFVLGTSAPIVISGLPESIKPDVGERVTVRFTTAQDQRGTPGDLSGNTWAAGAGTSITGEGTNVSTPVHVEGNDFEVSFTATGNAGDAVIKATMYDKTYGGASYTVTINLNMLKARSLELDPIPGPISGTTNDTGSVALGLTFDGEPLAGNAPGLVIAADQHIELTPTTTGYDYKIIAPIETLTGPLTVKVTLTYTDPSDSKVFTKEYNQRLDYVAPAPLTMAEGFETSGTGDFDNPLTLKQSVIAP